MLTDEQVSKYLDVDFGPAAKIASRTLGALPRQEKPGTSGIPLYGDVRPIIPETEWPALIAKYEIEGWPQRKLVTYVHDQDGEPSCVTNAFCAAHEIKQAEQYGKDNVTVLSPISGYRFVGSRMSGSTLEANMRRFTTTGVLPLANDRNKAQFKHTHPHNGYGVAMPAGWEETAKLFQNAEWADIESFAEFMSALLSGHIVIYARDMHCILAVSAQRRSDAYILDYLNSWSVNWGNPVNEQFNGGLGHDSERKWRNAVGGSMVLLNVQSPYGAAA